MKRRNITLSILSKPANLVAYIEHIKQVTDKKLRKIHIRQTIGNLVKNAGADNNYINTTLTIIDTLYNQDGELIV